MNGQQCRYLRRNGEQCTAEVLDPEGSVLICAKHAGRVIEMINDKLKETQR